MRRLALDVAEQQGVDLAHVDGEDDARVVGHRPAAMRRTGAHTSAVTSPNASRSPAAKRGHRYAACPRPRPSPHRPGDAGSATGEAST